ncbi:hypothetical protein KY329_00610 [Candidatus Woesearchaeota archaeon]|nr:hypothetical protein [Candidatus Woesearchaeota archaeon]
MILKSVKYREKENIIASALVKARPLVGKEDFSGSAPTPFIGRIGYPNINIGIMSLTQREDNAWEYDAPQHWSRTGTKIPQIVNYRTQMVNSRWKGGVKRIDKLVQIAQEVAMAKKPADVGIQLARKPSLQLNVSEHVAPMGPQAQLKKIKLESNPRIPTRVQKFHDDTDMLSADALIRLNAHGIDEVRLSRMLSTGTFGKNRKLVPTRWSITATDDVLGKDQLDKVRQSPIINEWEAYFGDYLGNYYLVLMSPEIWSYELFEIYAKPGPALEYSTDHEEYRGRKTYAEQCAGGYYTVRLAISEHLRQKKRQAGCLVLRFITDEYIMPLGVWVTREAARKTLQNKPIQFASKELMLKYAQALAQKKFGVDITEILKRRKIEQQKTLLNLARD